MPDDPRDEKGWSVYGVPIDLRAQIKAQATREGCTVGDIIQRSFLQYQEREIDKKR